MVPADLFAKHESGNPKLRGLWLKRKLAKAEEDVEQAKHALAKAEENALHEKDRQTQRRNRVRFQIALHSCEVHVTPDFFVTHWHEPIKLHHSRCFAHALA